MKPAFSVVVPTYNRADRVIEALASVQVQTFEDFEVIVCDDGSTDETVARLKDVGDERLLVLGLDHTGRPSCVRNAGIEAARGRYIAFLDSDDTWEADKLRVQWEMLRDGGYGLVCANAWRIIGSNAEHCPYFAETPRLGNDPVEALLQDNPVITSTAVVSADMLRQAGTFCESFALMEDYELWLRVASVGSIAYDHTPFASYRHSADRLSPDNPLADLRMRQAVLSRFRRWTRNDNHRRMAAREIGKMRRAAWVLRARKVLSSRLTVERTEHGQ